MSSSSEDGNKHGGGVVEKRVSPSGAASSPSNNNHHKVKWEDDPNAPTTRPTVMGGTGQSHGSPLSSPTTSSSSSPKAVDSAKKSSSSSSGGSLRRTSPLVFWLLLAMGCFQMFLYHPDIVANPDEHWFDRQSWKVANHRQRQKSFSSSNRTRTKAVNPSTPTTITLTEGNNDNLRLQMPQPKLADPELIYSSDGLPVNSSTLDQLLSHGKNTTSNTLVLNPIVQILFAAGLHDVYRTDLDGLPSAETLTQLYGPLDEPVVIGMDTCATYRNQVPPSDRVVAVAGMFNTGTNAMAFHLRQNIQNIDSPWQVPWGKHRMEYVRLNHTAGGLEDYNQTNVLPIVLIRDPFYWMQSMCKSPYAAHWMRRSAHCPNLVPDDTDRIRFAGKWINGTVPESFGVTVYFDKQQVFSWDSLSHLWSDWYRLYLHASYPRLMVRFEDLLFHGPQVMKRIAECAGVTVPDHFKFQTGSAKQHGSHATFLDVLKKTGDVAARVKQLTSADLDFAAQHLDPELMRLFRYTLPTTTAAVTQ